MPFLHSAVQALGMRLGRTEIVLLIYLFNLSSFEDEKKNGKAEV